MISYGQEKKIKQISSTGLGSEIHINFKETIFLFGIHSITS